MGVPEVFRTNFQSLEYRRLCRVLDTGAQVARDITIGDFFNDPFVANKRMSVPEGKGRKPEFIAGSED